MTSGTKRLAGMLATIAFLTVPAHYSAGEGIEKKDEARKEALEILLEVNHKDISDRDVSYMAENLSQREELDVFLENTDSLKTHIYHEISSKEHTIREDCLWDSCIYQEVHEDLKEINFDQSLRIYLITESLKDTSFCNYIGELIHQDTENKTTEYGGIITLDDEGKSYFEIISGNVDPEHPDDESYVIPSFYFSMPRIADFHLHALKLEDAPAAGPSEFGDLLYAYEEIEEKGESHNIVITSLADGKFNIDYYGGSMRSGSDGRPIVVDLGNYSYEVDR